MNHFLSKKLPFICTLAIFFGFTISYQNCSKQNFYLSKSPTSNEISTSSIIETVETSEPTIVNSTPVLQALDPICEGDGNQSMELPYSEVGLVCSGDAACPAGFNCAPCIEGKHCDADDFLFPYQANALVKYKFPPQNSSGNKVSNFGCQTSLEVNNITGEVLTFQSNLPQGSEERVLQIDIATYRASDIITITATNNMNQTVNLLQTCRMRTACYGDPTDGKSRPPEDSIRTFNVTLPAGTKALNINYLKSKSKTYTRIIGLCDFNLKSAPSTGHIRSSAIL